MWNFNRFDKKFSRKLIKLWTLVPSNPLRRFSDDLLTKKVKWSMINTARNTTHFMVPSTPTFFPICWVGFDTARNRHLWSGGYVTLHVLFHRDAYLALHANKHSKDLTVAECDFQLEIEETGSMKIEQP